MKKIFFFLLISVILSCSKDAVIQDITLKLTPTVKNTGSLSPAYKITLTTSRPEFSPTGEMFVFYEFDEYFGDGITFIRKIEYKATYQKGTALSDVYPPTRANSGVSKPLNLKITNAHMNGIHNYKLTW